MPLAYPGVALLLFHSLGSVPFSVLKGSHWGSCRTRAPPPALTDSRHTPRCRPSLPPESTEAAQELENQMKERQGLFFDMEAYLPKKNG